MLKTSSAIFVTLVCVPLYGADLAEVYQASLINDPVLGAAAANYDATATLVPQTRASLLPNINVGATTADNMRAFPDSGVPSQTFNDHAWQAELRQPLIDAESWFNYRASLARREQAGHNFEASRQDLIVRVATAYLNVLRAQAFLETSQAQEAAVKRQLEQVQQRFDVGLVAVTDVLESTAAYDAATVIRVQAEGDHDIFFETLRTLTGVSYREIARIRGLPIVAPTPDEETWVTTAMASNPTVLAAEEQKIAADRDVGARKSGHLPTVDAVASYVDAETGGANFLGGQTKQRSYELQLTMPIFQGGFTQARVDEAQARLEVAKQQLRERELTITRDTRNLFRAVSTDAARVGARQKAIQSAQSALEATETGYEVGTRNVVDVLQAQQRLYASQFDYADSLYNYVLDQLRLKQTAGVLAEKDLLDLNQYADNANPVRALEATQQVPPSTAP
jgi:outer membrane protein